MAEALEQAKATRNAAHRDFRAQLEQMRQDITVRGIGGRMIDRAGEVMADAADVAKANKGIVAGTFALVALWFMRRPVIGWIARIWSDEEETERKSEDD